MNNKVFAILLGFLFSLQLVKADFNPTPVNPNEGMWLPHLIKALNIAEMQKMGCKLSADEIYNVNNASIKDAVVQLGGFCTAEVVSPEGLLFTNHHCGYDAIQSHSSVDHDYLTDGFWAMKKGDELPIEGLTVSFLVKIEDVTERIMKKADAASAEEKEMVIDEEIKNIVSEAKEGNELKVQVKPVFHGNQYLMFVYEVYKDIRLVGAPPSSIGKFGGDTDNWMWPRQTGDFSIMRVYAGKDNKPASYSADNVPFKPKHFLPISLKGIQEGDFAMTVGYPGSTDRYLTSFAIEHTYKWSNPIVEKLLGERLKIMKEGMDADPKVRIQLASNYASLANYYKYVIGQNRGLTHRGLIEERQEFEKKFMAWVKQDAKRGEKYGNVLEMIKKNYEENRDALNLTNYINLAGYAPGIVSYGLGLRRLKGMMTESPDNNESWQPMVDGMKAGLDEHFKDYDAMVDQKIFASMLRMYKNDLPEQYHFSVYSSKTFTKSKAKGDMDQFDKYAENVYTKSILSDKGRMEAFLNNPSAKVLEADPGMEYVESFIDVYLNKLNIASMGFNMVDDEGMRLYEAGMMEMKSDKSFYPDANSTMRMSYGKVIPYDPRDGVSYKFQTFGEGILEKEIPGDEEFDVPSKLHDLLKAKNYGRYAQDGKLPLCFLTDNDITGGNSGSPVINGNGELIGIAFDGNWESMTSDLVFDPDIVRTISVDIRYVLFVIDKFAGAQNLISELKIVE